MHATVNFVFKPQVREYPIPLIPYQMDTVISTLSQGRPTYSLQEAVSSKHVLHGPTKSLPHNSYIY